MNTKKIKELSKKMINNYKNNMNNKNINFNNYSDFEYEMARQLFESYRKSSFDINKFIITE